MERELILIRHGRSAHVAPRLLTLAGFLRWREAYEMAGIVADELAPPDLREIAAGASVVVSSDSPRAIESARALGTSSEPITSPLLRELSLHPPQLRFVALPLAGWALLYGVRALLQWKREAHVTEEERLRAVVAADFLATLSDEHERVVVVTHATFRALLAGVLESRGWRVEQPRSRNAHWSAWRVIRGAGASRPRVQEAGLRD